MSVCYVYQDEYPWDVRVEKIITSLAEAGISTHLISRNRNGLPVHERIHEKILIHRLPRGIGKKSRTFLNFPAFFSPFWLKCILSTLNKTQFGLIIVRDLPLAVTAYWAGKLAKVPVVIDMAENYPAMIQDNWTFGKPQIADYLLRNPFLLRKLEKWIFQHLDGFIVVSKPSGDRVRHLLSNKKKPIWVVGNTPQLERTIKSEKKYEHPLLDRMKNHTGITLLYTGGLEESRGLQTVVRGIPIVNKKGIKIFFVIIGRGNSEKMLRSLSMELNVETQVEFAGWLDHALIPNFIEASDVCIVPHYVTEHIDTTVPNKIFDYMLQSKPVIATHAKTLEEIIDSCKCGCVYKDRDYQRLADILAELNDPFLRKVMGESGHRAILEKYNWNKDQEVLLTAVKSFINER